MSRVKQLVVATVVAILMVVGALAPGWADDHVPGELVVRFADDPEISPSGGGYATTAAELDDIFDLYELTYARRLISSQSELQNTYYLRFPLGENLDEIIDDLLELTNVLFAEKNWLMRADSPPNDYHFTHDSSGDGKLDQWTYYKMQSNRAWEITQGATSVVAAIIDTGLDWQHPEPHRVLRRLG